ncbi:MAG TPA: hypothetical protein VE890_15825, partial [Thermoguttaceae bacterium]|nr:hypothetical protein [Thermoguttaceae bacterium]
DIEPVESPGTPIADEPDAPAMQANPVSQLPPPPQDDLPPEPIAESPDAESPDAQPPASPLPEPVIPPDPVAQPDNGLPIAPMPESTHFPVPRVPGVEPQPNVPGVVIPEVETPDVATPDVTAPNIADVPPPAPEAVVVASVATKGQVLLRRGAQESVWQRAQFQEGLRSHARLIALPTYRPKVAMNSGTTVQLIDGTAVELLPADGQTADGMKMVYGRAILMPGPDAPSRFRLQVGDRSGVIVFADPQSAVAIEVATVRTPGTDPEALPALLVAKIYPRSGQVVWEDTPPQEQSEQALAIHPSLEIAAGQCLVINAMPAQPPVPVDAMPNWISPDATNALDSRASKMLEPALQANRSISLGLTELLDHRLQEVRWLAVRCLGHIGVFEPMVAALDDVDHKAAWPAWPLYIDQLTDALTRGPEVAAQVRQAMEKQLGEDEAAVAYRMLWGYTLNGLKEGEGQTLVDHLDHDLLAVRVLSFHNLEKATGLRLYYEPEQTAAKRRQPIRSWNDRLQSEDFWLKLSEREQEQSGGQ